MSRRISHHGVAAPGGIAGYSGRSAPLWRRPHIRRYSSRISTRLHTQAEGSLRGVPSVGEPHDIGAVFGPILNRAAVYNHPDQRIAVLEEVRILFLAQGIYAASGENLDPLGGIAGKNQDPRSAFLCMRHRLTHGLFNWDRLVRVVVRHGHDLPDTLWHNITGTGQ